MLDAFLKALVFFLLAIHPSVSGLASLRAIGLELGDLEAGGWFPGWFFTGHGLCVLLPVVLELQNFRLDQVM